MIHHRNDHRTGRIRSHRTHERNHPCSGDSPPSATTPPTSRRPPPGTRRCSGIEPYFRRPGYIEFRVGDYQHELGIIDAQYRPAGPTEPGGEIIQWHVDDLPGSYERLLALGATPYQPIIERGPGFVTAVVVDPFGNLLGIMYNQHYLDTVAAATAETVERRTHPRQAAVVDRPTRRDELVGIVPARDRTAYPWHPALRQS